MRGASMGIEKRAAAAFSTARAVDHGETAHRSQRTSVGQWTGLLGQLTHLLSRLPSKDRQDLLTLILADGINQGLTRMAEAVRPSA